MLLAVCMDTKSTRRPPPDALQGEELVPKGRRTAEPSSGRTPFDRRDSSEAGALPLRLRRDSPRRRLQEAVRQPQRPCRASTLFGSETWPARKLAREEQVFLR